MDAWIIGDHDALNDQVRKSLECAHRGFEFVHVLSTAACNQPGVISPKSADVLFYTAKAVTANDIELLRLLRSKTQASMTVVASMSDNAAALRAIRAGAEDFFDSEGDLEQEIWAFLSKSCKHHANRSAQGRSVAVLAGYTPSDASILATNLATVIARNLGSCALLDLHRRGGDPALLLKVSPRHTLLDLLNKGEQIDRVMFEQALAHHDSGVRLLAGLKTSISVPHPSPMDCQEIVELAQATHPFVIVTSDDVCHVGQSMALSDCNYLLLTTRLEILSIHRSQYDIDVMRQYQVPTERVEVVAMHTGQAGELPVAAAARSLGLKRLRAIANDPLAVTASINLGHPLVLEFPDSPATLAIEKLARDLGGKSDGDCRANARGPYAGIRAAVMGAMSALGGR